MSEQGTTVIADNGDGFPETVTIRDHYVLVRDGMAKISNVQVHLKKDGTTTHVITVKGCKPS